jgi:hypothetical protein
MIVVAAFMPEVVCLILSNAAALLDFQVNGRIGLRRIYLITPRK